MQGAANSLMDAEGWAVLRFPRAARLSCHGQEGSTSTGLLTFFEGANLLVPVLDHQPGLCWSPCAAPYWSAYTQPAAPHDRGSSAKWSRDEQTLFACRWPEALLLQCLWSPQQRPAIRLQDKLPE